MQSNSELNLKMHEKENEVLLQHFAMINDTVINQWLGA